VRPKVNGTLNLVKALENQPLNFCLMLSSIVSVTGHLSQANYAAGNAFMDRLANDVKTTGTHFISLNLAPVGDVGLLTEDTPVKKMLTRQGYIMLKMKEVLAVIAYAISDEAKKDHCNQVVIGFDYKHFFEAGNEHTLKDPIFSHLSLSKDNQRTKGKDTTVTDNIKSAIIAGKSVEQVEVIISEAMARKISTLVAIEYEDIDLQKRPIDFGLDSLVVIELKNWIMQNFQAKLQPHEISDATKITVLAKLIASRSQIVGNKPNEESNYANAEVSLPNNAETFQPTVTLPKQPLPDLDQSLDNYLEAIGPIFTDEEYKKMFGYVKEFREAGSFGRELQERLSRLANDPLVDNWQLELYNEKVHLASRGSLVTRGNFFGSHPPAPFPHSPARRAAIISTAAFKFKQKLEVGDLEQEIVNEQPVGTYFYEWFFNATREPRLGKDEMVKYPGNDYLVAFRHGHVFQIPLVEEKGGPISYTELEAVFQAILDAEQRPDSWVGVLTADDRDSWYKVS
jgi:acyl carrier protein